MTDVNYKIFVLNLSLWIVLKGNDSDLLKNLTNKRNKVKTHLMYLVRIL